MVQLKEETLSPGQNCPSVWKQERNESQQSVWQSTIAHMVHFFTEYKYTQKSWRVEPVNDVKSGSQNDIQCICGRGYYTSVL